MRSFCALIFIFCCLLSTPAEAQFGTIYGIVTDEVGSPILGATVLVDGSYRASTDSRGRFQISNVSIGQQHNITIRYIGFSDQSWQINMSDESISLSFVLAGTIGLDNPTVKVVSAGRIGDRIYVDDDFEGSTPETLVLVPGTHRFRVNDPDSGILLCTWSVKLEAGESRCFECNPKSKKATSCTK